MRRVFVVLVLLVAGCLVFAGRAFAQSGAAVEATVGWAGFVDDAMISHAVVGGLARFPVTPRVSIGPEITYMKGPDNDRDLFVMGNVFYDLVPARASRTGQVVPYVVGGGGFFRHHDRFGPARFASNEGTFSAGGGARAWVTPRVYVAADARFGWELHTRLTGTVGIQIGR